jgi:AraC-like DNA-binding protein
VVVTLRRLVPRPFAARDVLFRHAAGTPRAEYTRIFGGLVRFGGDVDRLVLARADLDVPIPTADRALLEVLDGYVARQVATLDTAGPTTRRVLDALDGVDAGMLPDIEVVGRMLAVSPRHLQRLLASEGTSFRVLADAMMRARAETLLVRRGLSASEVALVLGFSEASAFTRAFRRWTGTTPAAWAARRTARIET